MMCDELQMRDRLPAWVGRHGSLTTAEAEAVAVHVAGCTECAAEVVLLRALDDTIQSSTPAVDVARIASAIPRRGAAPRLTVRTGGAGTSPRMVARACWASRVSLAAAATVILMLGVSVSRNRPSAPSEEPMRSSTEPTVVPELAFEGVTELSDEALNVLLEEIAAMPAAPVAEPSVIVRPIIDAKEMP